MSERQYKYQITKQKLIDYTKTLPKDTPLPNRTALAKQCGVARVTLERAISELIGEGILVSYDGRGTYAADQIQHSQQDGKNCRDGKLWAILMYNITKGTAPHVLWGAEEFASAHDVSLIICNTDNDSQKELDTLKRLCNQNVDGIILIPSTRAVAYGDIFDTLKDRNISLVACSRPVMGYDFPGTFQNFFQSGFMAAQHLLQMGCREIAYFATSRYSSIEERLQGYLTALDQHNFENPDDPVHDALGLSAITGDIEELFEEFLIKHPGLDGIYVVNDRLVITLYRVLEKLHLIPGKDIRVVSTEDSGFSKAFSVPLSTVDTPAYKMGMSAAEQLYELCYGELSEDSRHIIMSCELHARESSLGTDK